MLQYHHVVARCKAFPDPLGETLAVRRIKLRFGLTENSARIIAQLAGLGGGAE